MKSIVIFCGSGNGTDPSFKQLAFDIGKFLANKGICVVYGGAKIGLMGAVADGALSANGKVIGVLPEFMSSKEIAHENLSELILVKSMHERKLKMHELSDGIIALPGGFGTMEELFEMLTWGQLGLHQKPIGILNHNHFYNALLRLTDTMTEQGLLKSDYRKMLLDSNNIVELFKLMENYVSPTSIFNLTIKNT